MSMSARLEVRIPEDLKKKLEVVAQLANVSVSDIVRMSSELVANIELQKELSNVVVEICKFVTQLYLRDKTYYHLDRVIPDLSLAVEIEVYERGDTRVATFKLSRVEYSRYENVYREVETLFEVEVNVDTLQVEKADIKTALTVRDIVNFIQALATALRP